jgi:hypothetical protein
MNAGGVFGEQLRAFGIAWVLLCIALALHVLDEALTDFLSVYNPTVQAIRRRFPFLPLPVFSFRVWLTGLCAAVLLALCLSPLAFHGSSFALGVSYPLAVVMFGNAMGHIGVALPSAFHAWNVLRAVIAFRGCPPFCVRAPCHTFELRTMLGDRRPGRTSA